MKPCRKLRKPIARSVLDPLDPEEAASLQAHLDRCPGCRSYRDELASVVQCLNASAELPPATVSSSFHRDLVRRILDSQPRSPFQSALHASVQSLKQWPGAAAAALTVLLLLVITRPGPVVPPAPQPSPPSVSAEHRSTPPPTPNPSLAAYRMTANISLQALDDLLNKQGGPGALASRVYTPQLRDSDAALLR